MQDYLETKRVAFPRFYFVAPADLLDILARGSNPQAVIRQASPTQLCCVAPTRVSLPRRYASCRPCTPALAGTRPLLWYDALPCPAPSCRHLPKCFDNIHNLEFAKDPQGNPTKTAVGMYSGEGEYVPFAAPCSCDGPVEVSFRCVQVGCLCGNSSQGHRDDSTAASCRAVLTSAHARAVFLHQVWLQNVVDAMRAALSAEFKAIIPTYDDRPRTKWIFENSVQNTIVVSRLFFTQEVGVSHDAARTGVVYALGCTAVCCIVSPAAKLRCTPAGQRGV